MQKWESFNQEAMAALQNAHRFSVTIKMIYFGASSIIIIIVLKM